MTVLKTVHLKNFGKKYQGKTRDFYIKEKKRILIATDRISSFDINLGFVPHKGQVLTQLSLFWFDKTKDIIQNHMLYSPDPNVLVVKNVTLIPIEIIVRGYMTGTTITSIWGSYQKGERVIYGITFPEGLKKNQKLPYPVITPTTHPRAGSKIHDERLTKKEILERKLVSKDVWNQIEKVALELFERGTKIAEKAGIVLVDTKYEFGIDGKGQLILADEIHTPDSSRFWIKKTYKQRIKEGLEPENFDKEFVRLWYTKRVDPYKEKVPPMSKDLINKVSKRYIAIYQMLTGKKFVRAYGNIEKRIAKNLSKKRLAVLISDGGTGTNLQGIIDGIESKKINAQICVVISDTPKALGLKRAHKHHLSIELCPKKEHLLDLFKKYAVDYVCLGGWKQIIPDEVLAAFPNRILNAHPGIVPNTFKGSLKNPDGTKALWNRGMFTDKAIGNVLDNNATYAGSTIHSLTKDFDFGKVYGRVFEKVRKNDTIETLYKRLKLKENKLYADVLAKFCK